ncbi:MAG: hypothetical protein U9N42_02085 [Campylobacterota bacterium]|nr:hypothetical protein [Campylobacterota bacterium]
MNEDNFTIDIDPTPTLKSTTCKVLMYALMASFKLVALIIALITWYYLDAFFAISAFLISFLIVGILRSYMRNSSIPKKQQEYQYNDKAIATWYLYKNYCF